MKVYKKLMNALATVEKIVLVSMTKQGGCGIIYPSLRGRIFLCINF